MVMKDITGVSNQWSLPVNLRGSDICLLSVLLSTRSEYIKCNLKKVKEFHSDYNLNAKNIVQFGFVKL